MLLLVTASSTLVLLIGWELVGLCSFMLIGHWWEDGANSRAALKAFFTTRTGDIGLLVGTSILFFSANSWTQEHLGVSGFSIRGLAAWAMTGLGKVTGRTFPLNADKLNEILPDYWVCSNDKARRVLGFAPEFELSSGMIQTVQWYRQNKWL